MEEEVIGSVGGVNVFGFTIEGHAFRHINYAWMCLVRRCCNLDGTVSGIRKSRTQLCATQESGGEALGYDGWIQALPCQLDATTCLLLDRLEDQGDLIKGI